MIFRLFQTTVRVHFPDRIQLQATFRTKELVHDLFAFVAKYVTAPPVSSSSSTGTGFPFNLYVTPPRKDLEQFQFNNLFDAGLTPSAVVYFSWKEPAAAAAAASTSVSESEASLQKMTYLKPEFQSQVKTINEVQSTSTRTSSSSSSQSTSSGSLEGKSQKSAASSSSSSSSGSKGAAGKPKWMQKLSK